MGLKNSYGGSGYDGEDSDSGSSAKGDESNHMQVDVNGPGPSQTEVATTNIKRGQCEPPLAKRFKKEEGNEAIEAIEEEEKQTDNSKVKMEEERDIKEEHIGFSSESTPSQEFRTNSKIINIWGT